MLRISFLLGDADARIMFFTADILTQETYLNKIISFVPRHLPVTFVKLNKQERQCDPPFATPDYGILQIAVDAGAQAC